MFPSFIWSDRELSALAKKRGLWGALETVWSVVAGPCGCVALRRKRLQAVDKKLTKFSSTLTNIMWFRGRTLFGSSVLQT